MAALQAHRHSFTILGLHMLVSPCWHGVQEVGSWSISSHRCIERDFGTQSLCHDLLWNEGTSDVILYPLPSHQSMKRLVGVGRGGWNLNISSRAETGGVQGIELQASGYCKVAVYRTATAISHVFPIGNCFGSSANVPSRTYSLRHHSPSHSNPLRCGDYFIKPFQYANRCNAMLCNWQWI